MIAFIIFQVFILVIVTVKIVFFTLSNPPTLLERPRFIKNFIYKLCFNLMDSWSEIMFWILFFTALYWFVAFKIAANAAVLLPAYDEWRTSYTVFYIVFGIVIIFRFVVTILRVIE